MWLITSTPFLPFKKLSTCCGHGREYCVTSSSTPPTVRRDPGTTLDQSRPDSSKFSPHAPSASGCPSAWSWRTTSDDQQQTAFRGPPWPPHSSSTAEPCRSPTRPLAVSSAAATARTSASRGAASPPGPARTWRRPRRRRCAPGRRLRGSSRRRVPTPACPPARWTPSSAARSPSSSRRSARRACSPTWSTKWTARSTRRTAR
mmetsp:Transcript_22139/g.62850  ORF Transcript_22139/g.62850 Transcript_22139/m.62850 type:complete len:203 (-) Transcript_22139:723-1331(-)